jgi:hypothetical protein
VVANLVHRVREGAATTCKDVTGKPRMGVSLRSTLFR